MGGGGGGARGMGGVKTSWEGNGKAKSHCNQNHPVDEQQKHRQTAEHVPWVKKLAFSSL